MRFGLMKFENSIGYEMFLEKEEFKKMMLDLPTAFKFKDVFLEDNLNTTFAIVVMENLLVITDTLLNKYNPSISFKSELSYIKEEEKFRLRMHIGEFYKAEFKDYSEEEITEFLENLNELEEDLLEDYIGKIPKPEDFKNKIENYINMTNNIDDLIREFKKENEVMKKKALSFYILRGLFDVNSLVVFNNSLEEEYTEKNEQD